MAAEAEKPDHSKADPSEQTASQVENNLPRLIVRRRSAATLAAQHAQPSIHRAFAPYVLLALALIMTGGLVGLYFQPPGLQFLFRTLGLTPGGGTKTPIAVSVDAPAASRGAGNTGKNLDPNVVIGLGKLIPSGDVVIVAPPYGAGDARIAAIKVKEGDRVTKGDILAILDNESQLRARIETSRATVAAKEAILAQTLTSVRLSRDETGAALRRATATARNAQRDFDRVEKLFRDGFATVAALDQKRTTRDETAREVERLQANLSRWDSDNPDRQPDVVVAQKNLETARADYLRAENDLDQARVKAPINGTVLSIQARIGERPGPTGVMNIGDIDKMTAEIEVYQTNISRISVGDAVKLSAESLPAPLTGRISRIGLEIGRQALIDPSPAANTDARVVKVYADLDPASSGAARSFTNLQVTARILTSGPQ
jgi:HlyD family secretion protein